MSIKLSFNNEIHKLSKAPASVSELIAAIHASYSKALPPHFALNYVDADGDCIVISSDDDFKAFLQENAQKPSKIFIVQSESEISINSKNTSHEIIDKKTVEEILKPEPEETIVHNSYSIPEQSPQLHDVVSDIVYSNIADIAVLVKEFIAEAYPQLKEQPKVEEPKVETIKTVEEPKVISPETFVHTKFTCDGCGVKPIVGIRYHCSVCDDYDFCEKCEATKEHAHPFLKIRKADPEVNLMNSMIKSYVDGDDLVIVGDFTMAELREIGLEKVQSIFGTEIVQEFIRRNSPKTETKTEVVYESPKVEEPKVEEPKKEEPKKEEPKTEEPTDELRESIIMKTAQLKDVFPNVDGKIVAQILMKNKDITLEDLIDTYLHQ